MISCYSIAHTRLGYQNNFSTQNITPKYSNNYYISKVNISKKIINKDLFFKLRKYVFKLNESGMTKK
jgi:hypothetical protein